MKNAFYLFLFLLFLMHWSEAQDTQPKDKKDTAYINALLLQSKQHYGDDPDKSIRLANEAMTLSREIKYDKGEALSLKSIGIVYYNQQKYVEALEYWENARKIFEKQNNDEGVANILNNMAAIYFKQGDNEKALKNSLSSLKIAEKTGNKSRIMPALITVASIYADKKATNNEALKYLLQALPLAKELGDSEMLGTVNVNIGEIYFDRKDYSKAQNYFEQSVNAFSNSANLPMGYNGIGKIYRSKNDLATALFYHNKALASAEKLKSKSHTISSLKEIAEVYKIKKDYAAEIANLEKASLLAEEIGAVVSQKEVYQELSLAYANTSNYAKAFLYQSKLTSVKDTIYNAETDKKLAAMQFGRNLEQKQGEIDLLTKDQSLKDAELKQQKFAKNALLAGLVLIFFIAFIIFRNYRAKVKINHVLDKQKDEIESLLLNILPAEVARELQATGKSNPRNYESVSVLFTDFKGFTTIADKLSPQELVQELGSCFMAFDTIIESNGLEKIKTIGDAYMCAGGIPVPHEGHVYNIVKASLEIQEFIYNHNLQRKEQGLEPWDIRIGIHVGPVVAGVVGKKKYAYDIWGSTVNIASRMESNGVPGHVNISSATYELIKDRYACIHRGKIYAKNVGEIDMYFIDHEIESFEGVTVVTKEDKVLDNGVAS
jgi:adenylate cyclase